MTNPDIKQPEFCWFDTTTFRTYPIDNDITTNTGEACPPIDCIKVRTSATIAIYYSKTRHTLHVTVGGRALDKDKRFGLSCTEDFDDCNYFLLCCVPAYAINDSCKDFLSIVMKWDQEILQKWVECFQILNNTANKKTPANPDVKILIKPVECANQVEAKFIVDKKPYEYTCPKCGSSDVMLTHFEKGAEIEHGMFDKRKTTKHIKEQSPFTSNVVLECIKHHCRICQYWWSTDPITTEDKIRNG